MTATARTNILYPVIASILTALLIWVAGYLPQIGNSVVLPSGMVSAFDSTKGCPSGWEKYEQLSGRVVVGAGQGPGLTPRTFRDPGGVEQVTLTVEHMPNHTHSGIVAADRGPRPNDRGPNAAQIAYKDPQNLPQNRGSIGEAGGSRPHENMQPFLVLHYCIKS